MENIGRFLIVFVVVSNIIWRLILQNPLHFYGAITYSLLFLLGVLFIIYGRKMIK